VRYLPDKKFRLPLKISLLPGSDPESARASPHATMYYLIFARDIQILNTKRTKAKEPPVISWFLLDKIAYQQSVVKSILNRTSVDFAVNMRH